ncbi:FtsB family cell division protein [Georgenia deserti]|uniref:Septum formation initiator family protein n=1 Tax=Georgenia deserti TaxID=2093781 RepID=A0ABW4L0L5_9MICO
MRRALAFGDGQSRPAISLRALALFVVILVAFVIVAPTLRYAVAQQEELRSLNADVAEARERNAELRRQIELWQNPEYVEAQARDRLGYVMPGETPYVVVDPETVTGGESPAEEQAAERQAERAAATPWYLRTWESVQVAGESAVGDEDPSGLTVPTDEPTP